MQQIQKESRVIFLPYLSSSKNLLNCFPALWSDLTTRTHRGKHQNCSTLTWRLCCSRTIPKISSTPESSLRSCQRLGRLQGGNSIGKALAWVLAWRILVWNSLHFGNGNCISKHHTTRWHCISVVAVQGCFVCWNKIDLCKVIIETFLHMSW